MGNVHVVGPNEALVISGGCCGSSSKRFITGGWAWTCCLVSDIQKLTLEVFTLNPKCEKIESKQGVPINVNAIAQCKIDKNRVSTAAEMFLGKDLDYIKLVVLQTIEGHLRAITGTLTMEEIYMERQTFATLVTEMASKDLENFGIALLSFTIKEISDKVDYLTSMGRKEIAKTKHKAAIDVANVEKDFKIKESDAELAIKETEYKTNKEIEEQNKLLKTESAKQNFIVNTKRKEAEMAYELETAKIQQKIAKEKKNVFLEEITMKHSILQNELKIKENDLHCDIILPAEAEAYRIKKVSELESYRKLVIAEANAKKMIKIADATSEVIRSNGKAQVELTKNRAAAFSNYNEAAVLKLTLTALPKITAEICAPLKNINEIVLVNGPSNQPASTNFASEASRMASELPVTMKALTGLSLNRAFDNLINVMPNNNPVSANLQNQNFKNNTLPEGFQQEYNQQAISNISTKTNIDSNYKDIDSSSRSSKSFESRTSSISNLSKQSKNSKQSLLNTKPKSVSNLSIQSVK